MSPHVVICERDVQASLLKCEAAGRPIGRHLAEGLVELFGDPVALVAASTPLRELPRETGVLIQTQGETWRKLRNGPITFYGGWLVVLMLVALGVFYKWRGPMGLHSPPIGKMIERFSSFERIAALIHLVRCCSARHGCL